MEAHLAATIRKPPPPEEYVDFELCIGMHCTDEYLDAMAEEKLRLYRRFMQVRIATGRLSPNV